MNEARPDPVASYLGLLEELLAARARGPVEDNTEEDFVIALNDWRGEMTPEQEAALEPLVEQRLKST